MSFRTLYPTVSRLLPALPKELGATARFALRVLLLRWWTWRLTRRLLFGGAAISTLLAAIYAVENWRGRRAFASVAQEVAAAGFSLDPRDLAQPPVPDEKNLAKISLFDVPAEEKARGEFMNQWSDRLRPRRRDDTLRTTPNHVPKTGLPSPFANTPADLAAFRREFERLEKENDQESLEDYLARLSPLLAELESASETRPYLRYDYDWDDPQTIVIPYVSAMRELAEIASLQSLLALERARPAEAARALTLPSRLRAAIARDPMLISLFTAFAIDRITSGPLWQGQLTHAWTGAELDFFSALLARDDDLKLLRQAYATELAWSVTVILQLPQSVRRSPEGWGDSSENRRVRIFAHWLPSGWLHQNAAAAARYHLHSSLASVDVRAGRIFQDRIQKVEPDSKFRPYESILRMVRPDFTRVSLIAGHGKTAHDLARLAVALEKHFLAHGAYPESLAPVLAADPALAALHDPFDGQPYRYRRDADDGFTLWGIGKNRRDDGGAFPDGAGDNPDFDTGDLVWCVPGPR